MTNKLLKMQNIVDNPLWRVYNLLEKVPRAGLPSLG